MEFFVQLRQQLTRPHVRPWALAAPILVLLICLPLLHPLRHPDPRGISDDELTRLATVQSLVEKRTLAIDDSVYQPTRAIAQPPVMAVLLAGPYAIMRQFGVTFASNPDLVAYLLTVIGAAIPVAAAAGLIYRMGRMFELRRPKRAMLAAAVVLASGLISYGVVLNAQAPAAALLLGAVACIANVAAAKQPRATTGWLAVAGMCAAFAATIAPAATIFLVLMLFAIPAMRWPWRMRVGGMVLYILGAAGPIILHIALAPPLVLPQITPDFSPIKHLADALLGQHGILTHFPIVLLGIFGVAAVMHRHWPMTTKSLATATLAGGAAILLAASLLTIAAPAKMFGPQSFILFLPLVLFWSGAWLRRRHHPFVWTVVTCALVFSITVALIGATNPFPRDGYDGYSAAQAFSHLLRDDMQSPPILAGR